MNSKAGKEKKGESEKKYAKEELKLKGKTLRQTAPATDKKTKSLDTVEAPRTGGMVPAGKETRIKPPSGKNIDYEALALRDRTLARTAPGIDPKKKRVKQVNVPGSRGRKKS